MLCVVLISASCLSAVWAWAEIPSARQQTKRRGPRAIWRLFLITDRSSERVGQTGSLPGFPERRRRKSQGKLPVCPTLAPRLSFFQASQCDIRELLPTNYATAQSEECKILLRWIRGCS